MPVKKKTTRKKRTARKAPARAKQCLIGVDPLAWLGEEETGAIPSSAQQGTETANQDDATEQTATKTTAKAREASQPCVVDLGTHLDIREAGSLYKHLCGLNADHFVLDATEVGRTDTAGLQLLTLFIRHVEAEGKSVAWQSPTESVRNAAGLLGLTEELRL